MPWTKEIFELIKDKQKDQNAEFVSGAFVRGLNDESMNIYNQIVGYNKAVNQLFEMEYEDLVLQNNEKQGVENE